MSLLEHVLSCKLDSAESLVEAAISPHVLAVPLSQPFHQQGQRSSQGWAAHSCSLSLLPDGSFCFCSPALKSETLCHQSSFSCWSAEDDPGREKHQVWSKAMPFISKQTQVFCHSVPARNCALDFLLVSDKSCAVLAPGHKHSQQHGKHGAMLHACSQSAELWLGADMVEELSSIPCTSCQIRVTSVGLTQTLQLPRPSVLILPEHVLGCSVALRSIFNWRGWEEKQAEGRWLRWR